MRVVIALPDEAMAWRMRVRLEAAGWDVICLPDGQALAQRAEPADLVLVHPCLPMWDGRSACEAFCRRFSVCPPRVLLLWPPEFGPVPAWADHAVAPGVSEDGLCTLLMMLSQKPLPKLTAASETAIAQCVSQFLEAIALSGAMKGHAYAAWLLARLIPSQALESWRVKRLYQLCAGAFCTSPANVERCLRVAVESVFTQGNLRGIERFFGGMVDPERGKPTNRTFLLHAAKRLRSDLLGAYSFTAARSPNSSEMHHSPAAPTSV